MSDKNSANNQSSSDNQTPLSPKVLKGGDIIERGSRLRYVDPDDTIVVRFEGNLPKKTRS
jgi:hypothetical protein